MIKENGIDFNSLDDGKFDDPMGEASGAGVIFGATGGVMEAALRTVKEILTGESFDKIDYKSVRGVKGIKETTIEIGDLKLKAAVAHGLGNARKLLEKVRAGEQYHMIEIMACPGGCVNGGGQPIQPSGVRNGMNVAQARARAIYDEDESNVIRKSHDNPNIQKLYSEFLGEPGGHVSHEYLHTRYIMRDNYPDIK
jgi:NADP-reducing hydrogenase subunit HndD